MYSWKPALPPIHHKHGTEKPSILKHPGTDKYNMRTFLESTDETEEVALWDFVTLKHRNLYLKNKNGRLPLEKPFIPMTPVEMFQKPPPLVRRQLFFKALERGDILYLRVVNESYDSYKLLALAKCHGCWKIDDLSIVMYLPKYEPEMKLLDFPLEIGSLLRAALCSCSIRERRLNVTLDNSIVKPEFKGLKLSKASETELPHFLGNPFLGISYTDYMFTTTEFRFSNWMNQLPFIGLSQNILQSNFSKWDKKKYPQTQCLPYFKMKQQERISHTHYLRGQSSLDSGMPNLALLHLSNAISLRAENVEALLLRGKIHSDFGNIRQAFLDTESAVRLNPAYIPARKQMSGLLVSAAKTHIEQGNEVKAKESLAMARDLDASNKRAFLPLEEFKDQVNNNLDSQDQMNNHLTLQDHLNNNMNTEECLAIQETYQNPIAIPAAYLNYKRKKPKKHHRKKSRRHHHHKRSKPKSPPHRTFVHHPSSYIVTPKETFDCGRKSFIPPPPVYPWDTSHSEPRTVQRHCLFPKNKSTLCTVKDSLIAGMNCHPPKSPVLQQKKLKSTTPLPLEKPSSKSIPLSNQEAPVSLHPAVPRKSPGFVPLVNLPLPQPANKSNPLSYQETPVSLHPTVPRKSPGFVPLVNLPLLQPANKSNPLPYPETPVSLHPTIPKKSPGFVPITNLPLTQPSNKSIPLSNQETPVSLHSTTPRKSPQFVPIINSSLHNDQNQISLHYTRNLSPTRDVCVLPHLGSHQDRLRIKSLHKSVPKESDRSRSFPDFCDSLHESRSLPQGSRRSRSPLRNLRRSRSPPQSIHRSRSPSHSVHGSRSPLQSHHGSRSPSHSVHGSRSPLQSYRSKSPPRSLHKSRSPPRSFHRSRSPPRSFHRSRSPPQAFRRSRSPVLIRRYVHRNSHKSRSPNSGHHKSRTPSPEHHRSISPSPEPYRSRSPSTEYNRDRSPFTEYHRDRSPSPYCLKSRSSSPDLRRSRSLSPNLRRSRSPSPNLRKSRSPSPNLRKSRSSSLNLHASRSPTPDLCISRSPSPTIHGSNSSSPDIHRNETLRQVLHRSRSPPRSLHRRSRSPLRGFHRNRTAPRVRRSRSPPRVLHRSRSPSRFLHRSGSPPRVLHRSRSPPRVRHRSRSPPRVRHRSRSPPRVHHRSRSPPRVRLRSRSPPQSLHQRYRSPPQDLHRTKSPSPLYHKHRKLQRHRNSCDFPEISPSSVLTQKPLTSGLSKKTLGHGSGRSTTNGVSEKNSQAHLLKRQALIKSILEKRSQRVEPTQILGNSPSQSVQDKSNSHGISERSPRELAERHKGILTQSDIEKLLKWTRLDNARRLAEKSTGQDCSKVSAQILGNSPSQSVQDKSNSHCISERSPRELAERHKGGITQSDIENLLKWTRLDNARRLAEKTGQDCLKVSAKQVLGGLFSSSALGQPSLRKVTEKTPSPNVSNASSMQSQDGISNDIEHLRYSRASDSNSRRLSERSSSRDFSQLSSEQDFTRLPSSDIEQTLRRYKLAHSLPSPDCSIVKTEQGLGGKSPNSDIDKPNPIQAPKAPIQDFSKVSKQGQRRVRESESLNGWTLSELHGEWPIPTISDSSSRRLPTYNPTHSLSEQISTTSDSSSRRLPAPYPTCLSEQISTISDSSSRRLPVPYPTHSLSEQIPTIHGRRNPKKTRN